MIEVGAAAQESMWRRVSRLFSIYRSIAHPGVERVLDVIREDVPGLVTRTYPSGLRCGSWTVPQEWDVDEAYVEDLNGTRVIDFKEHPFHVWLFSEPFEGVVSREELLAHVVTKPSLPQAIPIVHTYYQPRWGFAASQAQVDALDQPSYRAVIRARRYDGFLRIGEAVLPGDSDREIVLDSYICHPWLANDNQSGIGVAVELFTLLARLPRRRFTYRLLLPPETIGPIVHLHQNPELKERVVGGYTFVSVADPGAVYHYRASYTGESVTDRAMRHALAHAGVRFELEPFDIRSGTTGNEKAYNSLGFQLPIGSLRRTHVGAYPEHVTSADDLDFIRPAALLESLRIAWMAIQALERDVVYRHTYTGDPFLTGYGIYPHGVSNEGLIPWDYFKAFADGRHSLIDIADKARLYVGAFDAVVDAFLSKGLVVPQGSDERA